MTDQELQKEQFITTDQIIGRAQDRGILLGPNPHQTINSYIEQGLIPQLINGMHPSMAVDRLVIIDAMLKEGKTIEEIKETIKKERRSFLKKAIDLNSMVNIYKSSSFKGLLMLTTLLILMVFSLTLVSTTPQSFTGNLAREVAKPVGKTLAAFIRAAKPEESTSTDPLGLTNISQVIKEIHTEKIIIEKPISMEDPNEEISTNLNADTVDNAHTGTLAGDVLLLDEFGDINIDGNITIAGIFTGDGSGLTNLAWANLTGRPSVLGSIDGVSNDLGNIDLIAGAGVTITSNDTANTITFNLAGSGVNADLLDSLDSTQFLRSDTSDSFTSGTLTIAAGTTLDVLGTFTCTNCIGDAAVVNTITASNYLPLAGGILAGGLTVSGVTGLVDLDVPDSITASNYLALAGGTMAGNINFNTSLALNIGNAGTDFTASGGLNIAGDLDTEGHAGIGSSGTVVAATILRLIETRSDEEVFNGLQSYPTSSYNDVLGTPQVYGIKSTSTYSGADTNAVIVGTSTIAYYTGSGSASSLTALVTDLTTGAGSGAVSTITGVRINAPGIGGPAPTNAYGLYVAAITPGTTDYGVYIADAGNYSLYLASADGDAASGITFGGDTNLYRSAASTLTTDDTLSAVTFNDSDGFATANTERLCWDAAGASNITDCTGSPGDYAEEYGSFDASLEPGDLVIIDTNRSAEIVVTDGEEGSKAWVVKPSDSYNEGLIGVVSTNPNEVIGQNYNPNENPVPVTLNGRVPVKVSNENGSIEPGDPLTSSSQPGVAMKATKSGPVVGKALEAYSGPGIGKIVVFVSVGWFVQPLGDNPPAGGTSFSSIDAETLTAGTVNTQVLIIGSRKLTMNLDGSLQIDGNVNIAGEVTAKKLNVSSEASGSTILPSGQTKVFVPTALLTTKSQVLVTPTSLTQKNLTVTKKEAGKGFTVEIIAPETSDIGFDWFIVN